MSDSSGALSRSAFELKRLMATVEICSVCRFVTDRMAQHIDGLFYERVTDRTVRAAIRQAGGFCRYHARLVARHSDALGTALIMKDVLTNDLRAIDAGDFDQLPKSGGPFARLFEGGERVKERPLCPLCETERDIDQLGVDSLLEGLADPEFSSAYAASPGLCLPHFRLTFDRCRDSTKWKTVLSVERAALQKLTEQLGDLTTKFDYRHAGEIPPEPGGSWRRALNATSGWVED